MFIDASAPPPARLIALLSGYMVTQCLAIVARLGIADELVAGPLSIDELAARTKVDAGALSRVLRAAASLGVFEKAEDGRYAQTPMSALLAESSRPSFRHLAIFFGGDMYKVWASAFESVQTGKPVCEKVLGLEHFAYLAANPAALETFTKAMAGAARGRSEALLEVDWSGARHVVDIGGGDGTLLFEILGRQPALRGTVFDLPELAAAAEKNIVERGLGGRCSYAPGSFLTDRPPAADAYVFARVLHNWNDEAARGILRRVRQSAEPGARVVIVDDVLTEGSEYQNGKFLDLQMLVILGGRERTATEWRALLADAGFEVESTHTNPRWGGRIEARAV